MLRMTWDSELEKIASDFASKCLVAHNPDRHKQAKHYDWVGENIAWGTSHILHFTLFILGVFDW